jgi:arabinofuranan 3-O-arabinosyltransferase
MPEQFQPTEEEPEPPVTLVPPVGLHRTRFLLRAGWELRHDPEEWHAIVAQDVVNQMVGKTPIYNRRVLDITESSTGHAEELRLRGGHVTSMRRAGFSWPDPDVLEFSSGAIAAADESFDLVFATDVLSSVPDPAQLIDELVRVTRRGGTLYFQNRMWDSPWGGHDTSPWHLLGGQRARRRYVRKHGHEPRYRFNENLFKVHPGPLAKQLRSHPGLVVFIAGPRVLPTSWSWTLRLPLLRNLLVQDLIVVAERR